MVELTTAPPITWLGDRWDVRLKMPKGCQVTPGASDPPTALLAQDLIRFDHEELGASVVVRGFVLEREVDVADWLRHAPCVEDKTIVEAADVRAPSSQANLELTWNKGKSRWQGRYFAVRSGSRVFLLKCSAPSGRFAEADEAFAAAIESFEPAVEPLQPYSEPMRRLIFRLPVPWQVMVPESWIVEPGSSNDEAASFVADNIRRDDAPPHSTVGKLTVAVLTNGSAKTPREVLDLYLGALRDGGLEIGGAEIAPEGARRGFDRRWHMVATARRDTMVGELRCRVMENREAWVLVGLLGVLRDDDLDAWLQNKRVLDLTSHTLTVNRGVTANHRAMLRARR